MVTISHVQNGMSRYLDEEIIPNMTGWQRWVFGAGATIMLNNARDIVMKYKDHELVKLLGVIDEYDNIDIDKIYNGIKRQSAKGPVSFAVPGMGTLTLHDADVDKIYNRILGG